MQTLASKGTMQTLASKGTMLAVWFTTIILVLDTVGRLWAILGTSLLMLVLSAQIVLVGGLTMRRLRLGVAGWWMDLATGALLSGLIGMALALLAPRALRPSLLAAWWLLVWAYVALALLPSSPFTVQTVRVEKNRQSLQMRWDRLAVVTVVALVVVAGIGNVMLQGV